MDSNQWRHFWSSIQQEENPEIKIVKCCWHAKPQGESAGLVEMQTESTGATHNLHRQHQTYDENRQDMVLPIVEMLEVLIEYCEAFEGGQYDPLFPSLYSRYSADFDEPIAKHHPDG